MLATLPTWVTEDHYDKEWHSSNLNFISSTQGGGHEFISVFEWTKNGRTSTGTVQCCVSNKYIYAQTVKSLE